MSGQKCREGAVHEYGHEYTNGPFVYSCPYSWTAPSLHFWLPLLLVGGAGAAWVIYRAQQPRFPRKTWQPVLAQLYDEEQAGQMAVQAEYGFRQLLADATLPHSRALRTHLVGNILPGLALYRVLLAAQAGDQQAALKQTTPLFKAWAEQRYTGFMRILRILPAPVTLFRMGAGDVAFIDCLPPHPDPGSRRDLL